MNCRQRLKTEDALIQRRLKGRQPFNVLLVSVASTTPVRLPPPLSCFDSVLCFQFPRLGESHDERLPCCGVTAYFTPRPLWLNKVNKYLSASQFSTLLESSMRFSHTVGPVNMAMVSYVPRCAAKPPAS